MSDAASGHTDIRSGDWVDRMAPAVTRPYLRLIRIDRPIGTWLLLFPCWWSVALASEGWPDLRLLLVFAAGAFVMRSAGCTFNDLIDRKIDAQVERTRMRPLASGAIRPREAVIFLALQLALGLVVLLQLDRFAALVAVASLGLVAIYPFMKRGALVGWAAVTGRIDAPALALYAGGILWTLGYDTIYAHQDRTDDAVIGVKSTALRLRRNPRAWLIGFYGGAALLWLAAGITAQVAWPFHAALALAFLHFAWQVATVDPADPADCLAKFRANRWVGWIVFLGAVAGRL
jgi:4-hydroxybenzoate polyprenyltransferase